MNTRFLTMFWLLTCVSVANSAQPEKVSYKHVVSWSESEAGSRDYDAVSVFLDGNPIGSPPAAFQKLEELPLKPGDRIKLDITTWNRSDPDTRPVHFVSNFLQIWIAAGASIDFYEAGKKLKTHTVTMRDYLAKDGTYIRDWDTFTWVVDGKAVGGAAAMLKLVEKWVREGDVVVQDITPLGFRPPSGFTQGDYTQRVLEIFVSGKLRVEHIQPDTDHPPRKPDEIRQLPKKPDLPIEK